MVLCLGAQWNGQTFADYAEHENSKSYTPDIMEYIFKCDLCKMSIAKGSFGEACNALTVASCARDFYWE